MKKNLLTLLLLLAGLAAAPAQNEYDAVMRLQRMNSRLSGVRPMADGEHYTLVREGNILRFRYDSDAPGEALLPSGAPPITDYSFSADERRILLASGSTRIYRHSYTTTYYVVEEGRITPVLTEAQAPRDASFTPDGRRIVYSDGNDLYFCDLASGATHRITDDGAWNAVINGTTDWVYEEEFGFTKAYAVSPDGKRLAYLRFDESEVPMMEMMRFDGKLYNRAFSFKYPKAGERNSVVELWTYEFETGKRERIDTGAETDQYIPRIGFTPDGRLWYYRLNRRQNKFEMQVCEAHGAQRTAYSEGAQQYVERVDDHTILFVDNDRFLVRQEGHTGYMHLYLYSIRRGVLAQLTKGPWEVTDLLGTDGKRVWFLSTERSPLRRDLYSVALDGRDKRRLTDDEGFYSVAPSSNMKYLLTTFSNATTPNRISVCTNTGETVRTLFDSRRLADTLATLRYPAKEFFTFTTERGDTLNAYLIKPRDFDPAKRYPVLLTQYSGPGSQSVQDKWSVDWEQALVEKGYIVACADGRGTGFRGETFRKQTYGRLGALETEDQISFARYLAEQPYIDGSRIGIYGWSYGGFMALSCALKGLGLFRMAIAVAPVTTWRYYDTIYTEVYNGLPQYNAAGYDDCSPLNFARLLDDTKTRLLLIHGTADDNVHFQHTAEMARVLNRFGKKYDLMVYPDQNHSMLPDASRLVRQKMIDYTLEHL